LEGVNPHHSPAVLLSLQFAIDMGAASSAMSGNGLNMTAAELRNIGCIVIAASGTNWHAALVGEFLIEDLAQIPVEVGFAHEFCHRNCPLEKKTPRCSCCRSPGRPPTRWRRYARRSGAATERSP